MTDTVHALVEQWVLRRPDACALRDAVSGVELTCAELWRAAGEVAVRLRTAHAVGPAEPVGLAMPRSSALVVAMLGVLRAGGAYLPLEPGSAAGERTAAMLQQAGVRTVLHAEDVVDALRSGGDDEPPAADVHPSGPAYVAFTSGSTGRPKGVVVPHRAVVDLVAGVGSWCPAAAGGRVAHCANPAFDATTFELWCTLGTGGTVVVLPTVTELDLDAWTALLRRERVGTLFLTTSLFHVVARERPDALSSVDTVVVGGEQLDLGAARRVLGSDGPRRLVNGYGPTETTTFATTFTCSTDALAGRSLVPVGRPLPRTTATVLGDDLRPVAPGATGELYVGGPGVALGYAGQPALTAERFVPDPTGRSAAMYRTGDLARVDADGVVELGGRRDRQVKLRGFRIELDEIERAAAATGLVAGAYVDRVGEGAAAHLVGHVLPAAGPTATADDAAAMVAALETALAERLPAYLLPSRWLVLTGLPVGPTGKVDRDAFAAHVLCAPAAEETERPAPDGPLAEAWRDLLGAAPTGGRGFLAAGGNSILAVQLVARVRDRCGVVLQPGDVLTVRSYADLQARLAAAPAVAAPLVHAALAASGAAIPFAPQQERLWFVHQLAPTAATYHVPVVLRLRGLLDVVALTRALTVLQQRHELLHARVEMRDERPVFVLDETRSLPLRTHRTKPARSEDAWLDEVTRPAFDLAGGPAWRVDLLEVSPEEHLLALTFHHLVVDGWSVGLLARELAVAYAALTRGAEVELPALPTGHRDLVERRPRPAAQAERQALVDRWVDRLKGSSPVRLPPDGTVRVEAAGPGRGVPFEVPASVAEALRRVGREHGTTPFAVLLATFAVLVARFAGEDDVPVAVPFAGRQDPRSEGLVGFFVNTVVLRTDLADDPTFARVLTAVAADLADALAHQDVPLEDVVAALRPDRDATVAPLASVLFGSREPWPDATWPGLAVEHHPWGQGSAGYDLSVEVEVSAAGIRGRVDTAPGLFGDDAVRRFVDAYLLLLAGVAEDPRCRVGTLPLLAGTDRDASLALGHGPGLPLPHRLLTDLLADRSAATPDAVALEWAGGALSHAALGRRVDRLAAALRADGTGADDRVGILLPGGPELVVAVLGVLRAGAAYVPVDPTQSDDRLTAVLTDAGVRVVLTDERRAVRLERLPVRVRLVDAALARTALPTDVLPAASPEQLAYVVFTSGSTGRPKAVAVPHRAVVDHALGAAAVLGLGGDDRVLQLASPGFDVFAEEVFPTLLTGGRVVLPPGDLAALSVAELEETVGRHAVTVVNLPSSAWALWAQELLESGRRAPASLRLVVIGSEPVDGRLVERWHERVGVPLANLYGVSEATVSSTAALAVRALPTGGVPVGRPFPNVTALVLDAHLGLVPAGAASELHLGGPGLARGYLGRPGLTAERFVPDPWGAPGSRLYRTGDRARRHPSGDLEVLGRTDRQLKLRGQRVEPGEVESCLAEHRQVREAVVDLVSDGTGPTANPRLVGYVVPSPGVPPTDAELTRYLRERLPAVMVPTTWVRLDAVPRTTSGKLDRGRLPVPAPMPPPVAGRPPAPGLERELSEIWAELLGVTHVGVDDDVFALGAHSLVLTRLVSRLRTRLHREVALRTVFDHPTVAGLAAALDGGASRRGAPAAVLDGPVRRAGREAYRTAVDHLDVHPRTPAVLVREGKSDVA